MSDLGTGISGTTDSPDPTPVNGKDTPAENPDTTKNEDNSRPEGVSEQAKTPVFDIPDSDPTEQATVAERQEAAKYNVTADKPENK